jgi:Protein of unknown function (DUF3604)
MCSCETRLDGRKGYGVKLTRRKVLIGAAALPLHRLVPGQEHFQEKSTGQGLVGGERGESDVYVRMWNRHVHIVNASTHQKPGVPFRLTTAILRFGLTDRYRGRISFHSSDPKATLPPPYQFGPSDDLYESHLFEVALGSEGEHIITVRDEKTGDQFDSNRILVSVQEPKYKLYFGDLHSHSGWSVDARADPDYSYTYARDALNLNFDCLTEHDPSDPRWERVKLKAGEFYSPGHFVTFSAYEWTGHKLGAGHKNVIYRDFEAPIFQSNFLDSDMYEVPGKTWSAFDLWAALRRSGKTGKTAITVPHHPAAKIFPVPWDQYDPEFQRLVEVYSTWGNSEYPGGPRQIRVDGGAAPGHFVQDALAAGQRLGFVGGSDSHSGRPGYAAHGRIYFDYDYSYPDTRVYTGGITGVYAEELTREAVFDALVNRRCYAASGVRIVVDFRANDHWMGEDFTTGDPPHFSAKIIGTAPIESVTLVKNNADYLRIKGTSHKAEFEHTETEPPQGTDFYYLRVVQVDGEMAWSSPVWISS